MKTKQEMMEELTKRVAEHTDLEILMEYATDMMYHRYSQLSDAEFQQEYDTWFTVDYLPVPCAKPTEELCRCGKTKDCGKKCWWCGM